MSLFSTLPIKKTNKISSFSLISVISLYFWNPSGRGVALLCELTVYYLKILKYK